MRQSDDQFSLNHLLQKSTITDPSLRLSLVHHCVELLRELTDNLPVNPAPVAPQQTEAPRSSDVEASVPCEVPSALPEYGDEASLERARMEALEVFDSRSLELYSYAALWIDTIPVWGHPLLLCMGATLEGYRHILGFVEAPAQDIASMQRLFRDLVDRGLRVDPGPFCITSGDAPLSKQIAECLHPVGIQYCQIKKRERVLSYLGDLDFDRIKGAMIRAYALPDYANAHAALMEVHADVLRCNRSAAQWLVQDLEATLMLHRTGSMQTLSRSLRSTRCIGHVAQKIHRRLKGMQRWLGPTARRAQIALLLLEMELGMRKLDHAAELPALCTVRDSISNNTQDAD